MATSVISDLYQRYKLGTKRVVSWLAETASTRKKQSSEAALTERYARRNHAATNGSTVAISTKDLLDLAQHIVSTAADQPPPRDIDSIIIVLKDVISGRKEYAVWYAQKNTKNGSEHLSQDRSHRHFVEVLQESLQLIKQVREVSGTVSASATRPSNRGRGKGKGKGKSKQTGVETPQGPTDDEVSLNVLCNIYSGVSVVEQTDDLERNPVSGRHTVSEPPNAMKSARGTPDSTFELESTEEDKAFALWCFLKDCNNIRTYVATLWSELRDGKLSARIASQVSGAAFSFYKEATQDFTADFPDLASYERLAEFLDIQFTGTGLNVETLVCKDQQLSAVADTSGDALKLLCIPAFTGLLALRHAIGNLSKEGPVSNHADIATALSYADSCHPLIKAVLTSMGELSVLFLSEERRKDLHGYDGFIQVLAQCLLTYKPLAIESVLIFQVGMDVYDMLNTRLMPQYMALVMAKDFTKDSLQRYEDEVSQVQDFDTFGPQSKDSDTRDLCKRVITSGVEKPLIDRPETDIRSENDELLMKFSVIFHNFPTMAGRTAATIAYLKHLDGVQACNEGATVLVTAHLYTACLKTGLLRRPWRDMDFVIERHGAKTLGIRESGVAPPMLSAARNYALALGADLKEVTKARTTNGEAKERVKLPTHRRNFRDSLVHFQSTSLHLSTIAEVHGTNKRLGFSQGDTFRKTLYRVAQSYMADDCQDVDAGIWKQWRLVHKLTPCELLTVFKQSLVADEIDVKFDYHNFFLHCAHILDSLRDDKVDIMRSVYGLKPNVPALEMVNDILWDAAKLERSGGSIKADNSLLGFIARMMRETDWLSRGMQNKKENPSGFYLDHALEMSGGGHPAVPGLEAMFASMDASFISAESQVRMRMQGTKIDFERLAGFVDHVPDDAEFEQRQKELDKWEKEKVPMAEQVRRLFSSTTKEEAAKAAEGVAGEKNVRTAGAEGQ